MPEKAPKNELVQRAEEILNPPELIKEDQVFGLEKFREDMKEDNRMILPFLKIVQSMSEDFTRDEVMPGNFRNSLTGEVYGKEVEIFPMGLLHWRRRFDKDSRLVLCASNDARNGVGDPGGLCRECPLSVWHIERANGELDNIGRNIRNVRTKRDENLIAPVCSEQFVFPTMILSGEWKIPGALVFHKTYLGEGLRFYYMLEYSPKDFVYKVQSVQTTNEKGTWYVPQISRLRKLTPEEAKEIIPLQERLKTSIVEVAVEEEQENSNNAK